MTYWEGRNKTSFQQPIMQPLHWTGMSVFPGSMKDPMQQQHQQQKPSSTFMDLPFFPVKGDEAVELDKDSHEADVSASEPVADDAAKASESFSRVGSPILETLQKSMEEFDDPSSSSSNPSNVIHRSKSETFVPDGITSFTQSSKSVSMPSLCLSPDEAPGSSAEDMNNQQRFKPFHEEKWTIRYKELLAFHKENGHAAVPHTYPKNPQLARWVKRQRRQFKLRKDGKPSTMTSERLDLLDSVGFIWDSHDVNWREKLDSLDVFRNEHGHCNVPSNYKDKKLATWVKCQRRQYKLYWDGKPSAMNPERILELEKAGFEWEIRSASNKSAHDEDYNLLYETISEF